MTTPRFPSLIERPRLRVVRRRGRTHFVVAAPRRRPLRRLAPVPPPTNAPAPEEIGPTGATILWLVAALVCLAMVAVTTGVIR